MPELIRSATWRDLHWRTARQMPGHALSPDWRAWLLDRGSLTQRLIHASHGDFQVRVRAQRWHQPTRSEAQLLDLKSRQLALVRTVELLCRGRPWVYARTLLPPQALHGPWRRLQRLGNRSLGSVLFSTPGMQRGPIEIARCPYDPVSGCTTPVWGRRSLFYLHGRALLVSEFFLDQLRRDLGLPWR